MRTCEVDGCDRAHLARGYCKRHYRRWENHGDPLGGHSRAELHGRATDTEKPCSRCEEVKPLEAFPPNPRGFKGRHAECRTCTNTRFRARYRRDPEFASQARLRQRRNMVRQRYGEEALALEDERLSANAACHACGQKACRTKNGRNGLDIDHDHATGNPRGVLCNPCNRAIGNAKDDPDRLQALAEYLRRGA